MSKLLRNFSIRTLENSPSKGPQQVLFQQSTIEGQFGPVIITIAAELTGDEQMIVCRVNQSSGESDDVLFGFRQTELQYFIHFILPLFKPSILLKDGLPQTQEPQDT